MLVCCKDQIGQDTIILKIAIYNTNRILASLVVCSPEDSSVSMLAQNPISLLKKLLKAARHNGEKPESLGFKFFSLNKLCYQII